MISTNFDTFQARPTRADWTGPTKRTPAQTLSRACQARHLKTTTPGTQIPMARQREHAAFQNTAPALQDSSKSYFLLQSQWHGIFFHTQTLANALRTLSATRKPTSEHNLTPRPHLITGTIGWETSPNPPMLPAFSLLVPLVLKNSAELLQSVRHLAPETSPVATVEEGDLGVGQT